MDRERRGGLTGKARQARKQMRAARMQTKQRVDDFYDPDPLRKTHEPSIPIRGRSDFLPSAEETREIVTVQGSAREFDRQLELPLGKPATEASVTRPREAPAVVSAPKADAIRFPRREGAEGVATLRPPMHFRRKGGFTMRGFLIGCAMGGVAAALALAMLQTMTR